MERKRLIDVIPLGDDFFSFFESPPWGELISSSDLDLMLLSSFGQRPIAPIIELLLGSESVLSEESRQRLAKILSSKYKTNWQKKWDILQLEYNPINNYKLDVTENNTLDRTVGTDTTETTNITHDETNTITNTKTYDTTNSQEVNSTSTLDETNSSNVSGNGSENVFGFNSSSAVPSSSNNNTSNGSNTVDSTTGVEGTSSDKKTGTEKDNGSNTIKSTHNNERTYSQDVTNNDVESRNSNREGSLGIFTIQDMLKKEVEFWDWNYFDNVMHDVASFLTIPIYEVDI